MEPDSNVVIIDKMENNHEITTHEQKEIMRKEKKAVYDRNRYLKNGKKMREERQIYYENNKEKIREYYAKKKSETPKVLKKRGRKRMDEVNTLAIET